jgi:hypothetical protein
MHVLLGPGEMEVLEFTIENHSVAGSEVWIIKVLVLCYLLDNSTIALVIIITITIIFLLFFPFSFCVFFFSSFFM